MISILTFFVLFGLGSVFTLVAIYLVIRWCEHK